MTRLGLSCLVFLPDNFHPGQLKNFNPTLRPTRNSKPKEPIDIPAGAKTSRAMKFSLELEKNP
ncbi:hypothetical protein PtA15_3A549 [Puccinia triticina]|uniref:Uncharacterized protein n=1 Tax=Puccinia triticina TaxID=208348 RepID=A0ABY7CH72_9BASI|nr:uncharacterized protein PtA15_3A549 [Puccinia triticina]WAQ83180.1 hypothetical protein PtA15_3A549 [Puccinia triticina]